MEYALDLKNKIENKYLKDVLISSEIYYDSPSNKDDYSVLEKDNNHIKNFKKFELYNNDIKKGFVLRFTLNRETMYENNIKLHYVEYIERFVNIVWKKKETITKIKEENKEDEKQKELVNEFCRQLRKIKTDILEVSKEYTSDIKYHNWIKEIKKTIK